MLHRYFALLLLVALTLVAFLPVLDNDFVNLGYRVNLNPA